MPRRNSATVVLDSVEPALAAEVATVAALAAPAARRSHLNCLDHLIDGAKSTRQRSQGVLTMLTDCANHKTRRSQHKTYSYIKQPA